MIRVELAPRNTLATWPSRLDPTANTSPAFHLSEPRAECQSSPSPTVVSTATSSGRVANSLRCSSAACVRHCWATMFSAS